MEVCTIGGFEEIGKNMTAVKIGDDVIIFDAGIYLPAMIEIQEKETTQGTYSEKKLRGIGAIPDDLVLDDLGWRDKVRAIIVSHAHLDHVGAVPYIAGRYPKAKILGTPFTIEVLNSILSGERIHIPNQRIKVRTGTTYTIKGKSGTYKAEFVHTTHSTIQCSFIALHTPEKTFFYALDFKFDNYPTMGAPPDYKKFRELGQKGIDVLVVDSLYAFRNGKTPSERIARSLLEEAMGGIRDKKSAMIVTTFSSHIERLKSIVEFGRKTNRQIVFVGRSLSRYVKAAMKVNQCPFAKNIKIVQYRDQVNSFLKRLNADRGKFLVVCTGHQAEPGSILDRIVKDETPFKLRAQDNVIFSSSVIPVPVNIHAREQMDGVMRKKGVRIQIDAHVSGHGSREDLKDLIEILKPKHIIPAHGELKKEAEMIEIAAEHGYKFGETAHLSSDGKVLKF